MKAGFKLERRNARILRAVAGILPARVRLSV